MKRRNARRSSRTEPFDIICQLGDELRRDCENVRYTEFVYHDGRQWTVKACWERLNDAGEWVEIEVPLSDRST